MKLGEVTQFVETNLEEGSEEPNNMTCQDPESDICVRPGYKKHLTPNGFYLIPTIMSIHVRQQRQNLLLF